MDEILSFLIYSIWEYLKKLANEKGTTIMITTHYIEECRQAHEVRSFLKNLMFLYVRVSISR